MRLSILIPDEFLGQDLNLELNFGISRRRKDYFGDFWQSGSAFGRDKITPFFLLMCWYLGFLIFFKKILEYPNVDIFQKFLPGLD